MRILLVSSGSGSRGGGEIFLDYLGQGLADRGHEVLMWIPAHPRMNELAERCLRFPGGPAHTQTIFYGVPPVNRDTQERRRDLNQVRQTKRRELGLSDGDFLVVGLGRLVEQKRPFLFLETARKLHRYFPATKFLWVGDGRLLTKWKEWVAREKLGDVIFCAGWQADPGPFLLAGDLLLHVAEYEGLPLAILEAMTAGLPCAVTRSLAGEIPLFDETTVLFADDPALLAERLQAPSELGALAFRARQLVENRLSLRNMVESYVKLYERVGRR